MTKLLSAQTDNERDRADSGDKNAMNIHDQCPQQAEGVTFREVGGEAVLLNLNTGTYYGLNEVGTFVWQQMDGKHTIDDLVGAICATYAVDQKQAVADVRRLVEELLDAELVRLGLE